MADRCWLVELEKYQERKDRSQRENFLTAILAWVMDSDVEVRNVLLTHLFPHGPKSYPDARIDIQQTCLSNTSRPDITVTTSGSERPFLEGIPGNGLKVACRE